MKILIKTFNVCLNSKTIISYIIILYYVQIIANKTGNDKM